MIHRKKQSLFTFERLESRNLMASNIFASFSAGELNLSGSAGDDQVVLVANPSNNRVTLLGLGSTTINGLPEVSFDAVSDIVANLRGGTNAIAIESTSNALAVFNSLDIQTGSGNDVVWLDKVRMIESANIVTRDGDDYLALTDTWINQLSVNTAEGNDVLQLITNRFTGPSGVATGGGDDAIDIRGNTFLNSALSDRFVVLGGEGKDQMGFAVNNVRNGASFASFSIEGADVQRPFWSHLGLTVYHMLQAATKRDVSVSLANGVVTVSGSNYDDTIMVDTRLRSQGRQEWTIAGRFGTTVNGQASVVLDNVVEVIIDLKAGNDAFFLTDLFRGLSADITIYRRFSANLGSGNDYFEMIVPEVRGVFTLNAGDGDDFINLDSIKATEAYIDGGAGDDYVYMRNSIFDTFAFRGRDGNDTFELSGITFQSRVATIVGEAGDDTIIWSQSSLVGDPLLVIVGGAGRDVIYHDNPNLFSTTPFSEPVTAEDFETLYLAPYEWEDGVAPASVQLLYYIYSIYGRKIPDDRIDVR